MDDENLSGAFDYERQELESRELKNAAHYYYLQERDMKTSDMIQSKFLKKDEFDPPRILTIKDCTLEEVGNGDTRWVLAFKEVTKGLVLNVTKIRQLEGAYGEDTDYWIGQKVKLSHDPNVAYAGKIVGGIALQTSKKQTVQAPPPPPDPAEFNDDVPF